MILAIAESAGRAFESAAPNRSLIPKILQANAREYILADMRQPNMTMNEAPYFVWDIEDRWSAQGFARFGHAVMSVFNAISNAKSIEFEIPKLSTDGNEAEMLFASHLVALNSDHMTWMTDAEAFLDDEGYSRTDGRHDMNAEKAEAILGAIGLPLQSLTV